MDRQPFNLHSVLEHVRKLILVELPAGVEFKRDYDPSIPDVCGDRAQMIQVVLNIVRNAVQAMERRGQISLRTRVRRQYTLRNQRHRLVVEASITDNGPGIDPELIDRVFFPMVTGRAEGTGLGLALAQEIIHRHEGSIECTSEPGRTCFVLALPVGEAQ
jgi:two-component system nitrogen regulation sensor histidine kinase GlnL